MRRRLTLTNLLIVVNVVAYVWQTTTGGGINYDHGYLSPQSVLLYGQWWRVVTAAFLHGGLWHIVLNMAGLYWIGTPTEMILGKARFAVLYAASILGSGLAVIYFQSVIDTPVLGASGALYGLVGAMAAIGLRLGPRGRDMLVRAVVLVVFNLALTFSIPFISAQGHIGGLVAGFFAGLVVFKGRRRYAEAYAALFSAEQQQAQAASRPPGAPRTIEPEPEIETIEHPPDAGPHEEADAPPLHVRDPRE